jgi:hypothetical protein
MKGWIKWVVLLGLALSAPAEQSCSSTAPGNDCVRCQCQCQGSGSTATTTFEHRSATGELQELDCTVRGDCVQECARVSAPTPVSASCLAVQ